MKQVRVAIVGVGGIGKENGRGIKADPRARIVALCDLIEERMHSFAKELAEPVSFYTDYRHLCRDPAIDAVFVGTPNQVHVPVALEVVRNGKHVMVTKPLSDSRESAREVVAAAEAAGVVNMMSLSARFSDEVRYLDGHRKDGTFGRIYYARARSVRRSGIPNWNLGFVQKGGGAFRDMGVHALDAAWYLMGMPRPRSVSGVSGALFGPQGRGYWDFATPPEEYYRQFAADDYGCGLIRFEGGSGLQIESHWASHQPEEFNLELFGTEGGARMRPMTVMRTNNGVPEDTTVALPKGKGTWERIGSHFIDCIADGIPCEAPLRHGLAVQEMMEALLESGATGHEVTFGGKG
jgi:predicted dehydrogenase